MGIAHRALSILGTFLTLFGTAFGLWGTYFLAKRYYATPTGFRDNLWDYPYIAMLLFRKIPPEEMKVSDRVLLDNLDREAKAAEVNLEKTATSQVGFQLVFIGFLLQVFGGILLLADALLPHTT